MEFAATCLFLAALFGILAVSLDTWAVAKSMSVDGQTGREVKVGLWQTCTNPKPRGCPQKCVYHLYEGYLPDSEPNQPVLCPGRYRQTVDTCVGNNAIPCQVRKLEDDYLKAASAMATIGMTFILAALAVALPGDNRGGGSDGGRARSCGCCCFCSPLTKKRIISGVSICASICFLVAFAVVAGSCPCPPWERGVQNACNANSAQSLFCLMPVGASCSTGMIYSAGTGFVCCVLAWLCSLIAGVLYCCSCFGINGREESASVLTTLKTAVPQFLEGLADVKAMSTTGSVDYFACLHQLLSLLQIFFIIAILDHSFANATTKAGSGAGGAYAPARYVSDTSPFYPLPGKLQGTR